MFHFISWSIFLQYIIVILTIYWFTVGLIYYRWEIVAFIKNGPKPTRKFNSPTSGDSNDCLFDECNACANHLKSIISQNSLDNTDKGTILSEAKDYLKQHPLMFQAKWQIPINNLIEYECRQQCSVEITGDEMETIWKQ